MNQPNHHLTSHNLLRRHHLQWQQQQSLSAHLWLYSCLLICYATLEFLHVSYKVMVDPKQSKEPEIPGVCGTTLLYVRIGNSQRNQARK
ncbi:hypothetical protein P8452_47585 [Trifolium repens]|nr:hypothetical protein P8452_47585 [Trifolium repens]